MKARIKKCELGYFKPQIRFNFFLFEIWCTIWCNRNIKKLYYFDNNNLCISDKEASNHLKNYELLKRKVLTVI